MIVPFGQNSCTFPDTIFRVLRYIEIIDTKYIVLNNCRFNQRKGSCLQVDDLILSVALVVAIDHTLDYNLLVG